MILTDRTVMVNGNVSSLDSKVYLYRGDKNIQINFSVVNSKFRFTKKVEDNILESSNAAYSVVKMIAPNGKKIDFPAQLIENGKATWLIEEELINDIDEVGVYDIQIRLLNEEQDSIITIPPIIEQIEVLEPIFVEEVDDTVGNGKINSVRTSSYSGVQRETLLPNGNYNRKTWEDDEVIYKEDLNTLEDISYKNREKILQQDKSINKIPTKTIVEDGKLFLTKDDGTKIDSGTILSTGSGGSSGTSIDDTTISTETTWSSEKIEDFVLTNDDVVWTDVSGKNLSVDYTKEGHLREVEIFGNTIQNEDDLSDIQHLGELYVDDEGEPVLDELGREQYKIEIESCNTDGYYKYHNQYNKDNALLTYGHGRTHSITENSIVTTYVQTSMSRTEYTISELEPNTQYRFTANLKLMTDNNNGILKITNGSNVINVKGEKLIGTTITSVSQKIDVSVKTSSSGTLILSVFNVYLGSSVISFNGDVILEDIIIAEDKGKFTLNYPQSNKTTILLPCQLMKVGDVADRLYWDSEKGRYIVEKKILSSIITKSTATPVITEGFSTIRFRCGQKSVSPGKTPYAISSRLPSEPFEKLSQDVEMITTHSLNSEINFRINKDKLETIDNAGFNKWLNEEETIVYFRCLDKYVELIETNITEKILLPCYKDKTHIFVSGGIGGYIKAKAPLDGGQAILSLSQKNKELQSVNQLQDELINISLCATDEMYMMIEPLLVQTLSLQSNDKMINLYVAMVQRGLKDINEVPIKYREQVITIIDEPKMKE